jgi:8-oxo-dGTP pyrophosphatase MutT (NUDIX family)
MTVYTVDENRAWYNNLPTKRVSAAMIIRDGDNILMVKATYKDRWTFPGGVVDADESPFVAAIRETQEEVGLIATDVKFVTVCYVPEVHGFKDRLHFFFETTGFTAADTITAQESEIEQYEWVPISKIGELSGNRFSYVSIQNMLESGDFVPFIEPQDDSLIG